jgi:hypothetical protein
MVTAPWLPRSILTRGLLAKYLFTLMVQDGLALFTGFGAGENARALLPWGTAESGYMTMLFFYGTLFVLAYLLLLKTVFSQARRLRRSLPPGEEMGRGIATAVISIVAAMAVMNIVHPYYTAAGVTHYFWIVLGCMMALRGLYRRRPVADTDPTT